MSNGPASRRDETDSAGGGGRAGLPAVALPKGGGAIRGIGEKFATNAASGTGSLSITIPTSPGRAGFKLNLELAYDSGSGNGKFGIGWHLSTPCISRKTEKGLPRYLDAEESDTFVLAGAEDLVPVRVGDGTRLETFDRGDFRIWRYRPRLEGLFARIERWTDRNTGDIHWRIVSHDNVTNIYGRSPQSRIADPDNPWRVFTWLIDETRDDRGNIARYIYKPEDESGIDVSKPSEAGRFENGADGVRRFKPTSQRYLKRIEYGNRRSGDPTEWLFEVVFDYGEHDTEAPTPEEVRSWPVRLDAFSTYRPGFEVRTSRLCRRVLMFHKFAELGPTPCLVRSVDFQYEEGATVTYLTGATQCGYKRDPVASGYQRACLPTLEFDYNRAELHDRLTILEPESRRGVPGGVDGSESQWVDLDGEGLPGVLRATDEAWYYKSNLGGGKLAPPKLVPRLPAPAELHRGARFLLDLSGDGELDLVGLSPSLPGYFTHRSDRDWDPFVPFQSIPNLDWNDPNLRLLDLDGDGFADALLTEEEVLVWYPSRAREGFGPPVSAPKPATEEDGPAIVFADQTESIQLADLSGDGSVDIVRIRQGEVCYWPNLGYGRFGRKVTMNNSPRFDAPEQFDPRRLRLTDIDGSGTTDLVYLGREGVCLWLNQSGNGWSERKPIRSLPVCDSLSNLSVVDLLGAGTGCLVLSSPLPASVGEPLAYVDLMGGLKPHLLCYMKNNLGAETRISYAPSTRFYLQDKEEGRPWLGRLHFPVHVIERIERYDGVTRLRLVTRFRYHHGFFDGHEREFGGFAMVEQWDAESVGGERGKGLFPEASDDLEDDLRQPPVLTRTWFHPGLWLGRERIEQELARDYYRLDPDAPLLSDTILPSGLTIREEREAARALRGRILRQETYSEDSTPESIHPYSVSERNYQVRCLQCAEGKDHAVFFVYPGETVNLHYERRPDDPRLQHEAVLEVDDFGHVTRSIAMAYPRRAPQEPEQSRLWATFTEGRFVNRPDEADWYRLGALVEMSACELTGLPIPASGLIAAAELRAAIAAAVEIPYEAAADGVRLERRLVEKQRLIYYRDDLAGPLPLGQIESRCLQYEGRRMAMTRGLVASIYGDRVNDDVLLNEGRYLLEDDAWWVPSGRVVYDPARFYLPVESIDPFDQRQTVSYDDYALLICEACDPVGNTTRAANSYRILAPTLLTDANGNRTAVEFDALGMAVKTAFLGKEGAGEGDTLADPTTRIEYDLDRWRAEGKPAFVKTLARERHGSANPRWQESYSYSDGAGREVMRKVQAEAGPAPGRDADGRLLRDETGGLVLQQTANRWVGTGRIVLDNKGNLVKKYEPFFSSTREYEDEKDLVEWGVTPIFYYDPLGRLVRTDQPHGTQLQVKFDSWKQENWDENDSIRDSRWLTERQSFPAGDPERRAADLAIGHAGTPGVTHLDALGRAFLKVADNGPRGKYQTRIELDIEGNERSITDARGIRTLAQGFDILGRRIELASADAGRSQTLLDVTEKSVRAWDARGHSLRCVYDALQRLTHIFVNAELEPEKLVERRVYGESHPQAQALNLRRELHQSYDGSGVVTRVRFDFKGNLLEETRQLARLYRETVDWSPLAALLTPADLAAAAPLLEAESFTTFTSYDALNRCIYRQTPDGSETLPYYNESNLLEKLEVRLRNGATPTPFLNNIDYNARGQRERIEYGNGAVTECSYDEKTFRLSRLRTRRLADGRTLQDLRYTYDPLGNVLEIRDEAEQVTFFNNSVVRADRRYQYDALYQLVEAEGREHSSQQPVDADLPWSSLPHSNDLQALRRYSEQYTYDSVGNIERVRHQPLDPASGGWTRHYEYAADCNRLLRTNAPGDPAGGPWSHDYGYDAHGNTTGTPHLAELRWDHGDRLEYVDRRGGGEVYFTYGADGQRVRKVYEHNGLVEERIYLSGYEVYRKRPAAGGELRFERQTLHVLGDDRRLALVETVTRDSAALPFVASTRLRYQLDNHLGSAVIELDEAGGVISYEEHYPFGAASFCTIRADVGGSVKRYRYTGKERDEETGFHYFGARYYAAWLGRWISVDPAGFVDGVNVYSYVKNNPLSSSDLTGKELVGTVSSFEQGIRFLQRAAMQESVEYALARHSTTGEYAIFRGSSGEINIPDEYRGLAHSHVYQDAVPSQADLSYVARHNIGRHIVLAARHEGVSLSVIEYDPATRMMTQTNYLHGRISAVITYDTTQMVQEGRHEFFRAISYQRPGRVPVGGQGSMRSLRFGANSQPRIARPAPGASTVRSSAVVSPPQRVPAAPPSATTQAPRTSGGLPSAVLIQGATFLYLAHRARSARNTQERHDAQRAAVMSVLGPAGLAAPLLMRYGEVIFGPIINPLARRMAEGAVESGADAPPRDNPASEGYWWMERLGMPSGWSMGFGP